LSFEIYHPKNNVHNQDGNHNDNEVWITFFFFELTDNDGQNFLAGIVLNSKVNVESKCEVKMGPFYLKKTKMASISDISGSAAILKIFQLNLE
jgi:hypothetical protein